ncbi:alpha/beta fold hydrolase, partial [Mesorhizobium sp.]
MADAVAPGWTRAAAPDGTGFIRAGSGAPVLFIHGVGMNATIWQPQIQRMADRFDLIAIDMLGHGRS